MKLRQKLAVVLASAMVLTAVPVVTMAQATTTLKREVITIKKDETFATTATANAVKVSFDNDTIDGTDVVYLTLENAEWSNAALDAEFGASTTDTWTFGAQGSATATGTVTYTKQTDKVMKVAFAGHASDSTVYLPLLVKATGGDAKVTIENRGNGTLAKTSTYVFATTGEKKMNYKVGDVKTFYRDGELSKLTIEETYPGSLAQGGTFTLELDDTDFIFDSNMEVTLKGLYGFGGTTKTLTVTAGELEIDSKDKGSLKVTIPAMSGDGTLGTIEITGVEVKSLTKTPEEGDFLVDIKGDDVVGTKTDLLMGKVTKYSTYIKMKDDKAVDVKAGRIQEIKFSIGESVEDSLISNREIEVKLDNGHFDYKGLVNELFTATKDGVTLTGAEAVEYVYGKTDDTAYKKAAANLDSVALAKEVIENSASDEWATGTGKDLTNVEFDVDSEGKAIVDTLIVNVGLFDGEAAQANEKEDEMKFVVNVCVPVTEKDSEKVTLTAEGRALENELSTTAINIINPFDVKSEQATLKVGLQGQVSGSLSLTETDKDMFQKGDITFAVKNGDEQLGIYLTDVEFETSSSIKGEKTSTNKAGRSATITLNRVTKEAGSLAFKDMTFTVDRTVPEGTYDLEISGTGIDADGHSIVVKDFIKITTANTQDITANGLAKGSSTFVIGESKYVFEGKEFTMDAPSYIQDPGYTMVPVRYVAQAFGVAEKDILFGNGTVTIFAGERTISLTNGSNNAVVNGNPVAMGTAVVIKEGRTYAPAGEIARLLGISTSWDATTKTATFTNK